jgi:hypothetical protein
MTHVSNCPQNPGNTTRMTTAILLTFATLLIGALLVGHSPRRVTPCRPFGLLVATLLLERPPRRTPSRPAPGGIQWEFNLRLKQSR